MNVNERIEALWPQMVDWRRYLHQNPELSYEEKETAAFVAARLTEMGIPVRTGAGGHGVIGNIVGAGPGPTVALRADMDALPIQDEKTCEYASKVPGVMHACGHDAHTATLLGVAKALQATRSEWRGTVRLLFQPAEEISPGGALPMIKDGALDGVDRIYGVHLWTPFPVGEAATRPGALMAAADEFRIKIRGKGGHGGAPHTTVDSLVIASQLVLNLQTIVSRAVDPIEPCVVSVGSIHGGNAFNVISESCTISGTVRTFNLDVRDFVKERIESIANNTCAMFGAECEFIFIVGYPPVVNDERETDRFFQIAPEVFGSANVRQAPLMMPGEDFAYYLQKVPGCFMLVGAGNPEHGIAAPHHHPRFDIDESAMKVSARLMIAMAMSALNENIGTN